MLYGLLSAKNMQRYFLLWIWLGINGLFAQPYNEVVSALEQHLYALPSYSLTKDHPKWSQLDSIWERSDLLGLGESSHGVHEFFEIKTALMRWTIKGHGVKLILFESPYFLEEVHNYVYHDQGTLEGAMDKMGYWIWQTQELKDFIAWLHDYNLEQSASNKVYLLGVDLQSLDGVTYWQDLLEKYSWTVPKDARILLKEMDGLSIFQLIQKEPDWLERSEMRLTQLIQWASKNQTLLHEQLGPLEGSLARYHLNVIQQNLGRILAEKKKLPGYINFRDSCMAINAAWLKKELLPTGKAIFWAHNNHVSYGKRDFSFGVKKSAGSFLRKLYGEKYYAVGLDFGEGSFLTKESGGKRGAYIAPDYPRRSLNAYLMEFDHGCFLMSWSRISADPSLSRWASQTLMYRNLGGSFNPQHPRDYWIRRTQPAAHFDAWVFVKNVKPSQLWIKSQLGLKLPAPELCGKDIQLTAWVRPLGPNYQAYPPQGIGIGLGKTASPEFYVLHPDVGPVEKAGWRQFTWQESLPSDLVDFKLLISCTDPEGMGLDEVTLQVKDSNGSWQVWPDFHFDFESPFQVQGITQSAELNYLVQPIAAYRGEGGLVIKQATKY